MLMGLHPLNKVILEQGGVWSFTSFFSVPNGGGDLCMVYDGTKSGFNQVVWAPWFPLPTTEQHLCVAKVGCYMADIDVGEMFLNCVLHVHVRVFVMPTCHLYSLKCY